MSSRRRPPPPSRRRPLPQPSRPDNQGRRPSNPGRRPRPPASRPSNRDSVPELLDGRYAVRRQLGRGGMATILEATDTHTGDIVALKLMLPNQINNFDAVLRFEREGAVIAEVQHVNLVSVVDRGRHQGLPYIALELVDGPTLEDYVKRVGPLGPQLALELAWQATQGLAALHGSDIVHRDIKPANLLLETTGFSETVKIADFGFIQVGRQRLTDPGSVLGTVATMAPEQILGEEIDVRTDIYALGVTLYFMLTGELPFTGGTSQVMAKHLIAPPPLPSQLNHEAGEGIDRIVVSALRKAPTNRYPSANAMAQDIRRPSPRGVPLAVDPDEYQPSTKLGVDALETFRRGHP